MVSLRWGWKGFKICQRSSALQMASVHMPFMLWFRCHSVTYSVQLTQADDSWFKHPSLRLLLDRLVDYAREQSAAGKADEAGYI